METPGRILQVSGVPHGRHGSLKWGLDAAFGMRIVQELPGHEDAGRTICGDWANDRQTHMHKGPHLHS